MAKKATILDVAKAAEVSIATVSRVLNNPESVRTSTRLRVEKAFADTGYTVDPPEQSAETMIKGRLEERESRMLLTIIPDLKNPFYSDLLDGITAAAGYQGYDTILYQVHELRYTFEQLKKLVDSVNVCGVLLVGKVARSQELKKLCEYIPVVQCTEYVKDTDTPFVSIDDYAATKTAMKLLLQRGHRRIAMINGPIQYKYAEDRERAFRDAMEQAGLKVDNSLVIRQAVFEFELAVSNISRILNRDDHPDAVYAVSDVLAVAAVKAAKAAGLRVPEDVAVVGFDGTFVSQLCDPPLTVIQQPAYQLGYYGCEMLINKIRGVDVSNPQILLNVELLVREST